MRGVKWFANATDLGTFDLWSCASNTYSWQQTEPGHNVFGPIHTLSWEVTCCSVSIIHISCTSSVLLSPPTISRSESTATAAWELRSVGRAAGASGRAARTKPVTPSGLVQVNPSAVCNISTATMIKQFMPITFEQWNPLHWLTASAVMDDAMMPSILKRLQVAEHWQAIYTFDRKKRSFKSALSSSDWPPNMTI